MPVARQIFVGGVDSDTVAEQVAANKLTEADNLVLEPGAVETAWGNAPLPAPAWLESAGSLREVGGATDTATGTHYYLLYDAGGSHVLARYVPATGAYDLLLQWSGLHLPGAPTHNVGFLDGFVVYIDANRDVRCLPVTRIAEGFYTPALLEVEPYALHLLKLPPQQAPTTTRTNTGQVGQANLLAGRAYQFATRWRYADGEATVLSPPSLVSEASLTPEQNTSTAIVVDFPETAPALVQELDVLVREGTESVWLVAKRFLRNGNQPLPPNFTFTGTNTGEAVDATEATRTHEALWKADVLTIAQDRLWVANLEEGHLTPAVNLSVAVEEVPVPESRHAIFRSDITTRVVEGTANSTGGYIRYYILRSGTYPQPSSTYYEVIPDQVPSFSSLPNLALFFRASRDFLTYNAAFVAPVANEQPGTRRNTIESTERVLTVETPTLHENSAYTVALQYYDVFGHPFGASSPVTVTVPPQNYREPRQRVLAWNLPPGPQSDIPAEAATYSLLLSRSGTATTFQQGLYANVLAYLGRDRNNVPLVDVLSRAHEKIWVDIGNLPAAGQGYTFVEGSGDMARFVDIGLVLPITGQVGEFLEFKYDGTIPTIGRIELFTPAAAVGDTPPLYERSPRYGITRDEFGAAYSVTQGQLVGDSYVAVLRYPALGSPRPITYRIEKNVEIDKEYGYSYAFPVERMAPVGRSSNLWLDASRGRAAFTLPTALQHVVLPATGRFSGVRLAGTQTNGLSNWAGEDTFTCPQEQGAIQALLVASQTQGEGNVLLAVQQAGATSLYLGQVPLSAATGGQVLALADKVVGGQNPLRGGFGTRHPASVIPWQSRAYWWDAANAELIRYDNNGAQPLAATYKCRNLCRKLAADYQGATVFSAYDASTETVYVFFGAVHGKPPVALVFSEKGPAFMGLHTEVARAHHALSVGDLFISSLDGLPHPHRKELPRLTFFGQPAVARARTVANQLSEASKQWQSIGLSTPAQWSVAVENELGQRSRVLPVWMKLQKGIWRAGFHRDEASTGFKSPDEALYYGKPLQSPTLDMTLTYAGTAPARLVSVDLLYLVNAGQAPPP